MAADPDNRTDFSDAGPGLIPRLEPDVIKNADGGSSGISTLSGGQRRASARSRPESALYRWRSWLVLLVATAVRLGRVTGQTAEAAAFERLSPLPGDSCLAQAQGA
jgi:hypothetical protein